MLYNLINIFYNLYLLEKAYELIALEIKKERKKVIKIKLFRRLLVVIINTNI